MRRLIYLIASLMLVSLVGCEKYALDRQMEELCKKDGGMTILETVTLPATAFYQTGQVITSEGIPDPNNPRIYQSVVRGGEYLVVREETIIKAGEPSKSTGAPFGVVTEGRLLRFEVRVVRIANKKILGTGVSYGRSGGGFSLGHPDSKTCPSGETASSVEVLVFKTEK